MLSCLESAQQPVSTFEFQLFVGSAQMFEYKHYWGFGVFFLEQTILIACVILYLGMVTGHHMIFREILYFRAVSIYILFMISWTFVLTSVMTPTCVEKFNKFQLQKLSRKECS